MLWVFGFFFIFCFYNVTKTSTMFWSPILMNYLINYSPGLYMEFRVTLVKSSHTSLSLFFLGSNLKLYFLPLSSFLIPISMHYIFLFLFFFFLSIKRMESILNYLSMFLKFGKWLKRFCKQNTNFEIFKKCHFHWYQGLNRIQLKNIQILSKYITC